MKDFWKEEGEKERLVATKEKRVGEPQAKLTINRYAEDGARMRFSGRCNREVAAGCRLHLHTIPSSDSCRPPRETDLISSSEK